MNEREVALNLISDILNEGAYNNIILRRFFNRNKTLSTVERSFITEVVNGTLRNLIHIDYIIDFFSKTKTKKMKPVVLNILRISVYQIMFMDRVPASAVVNEAVKIMKKRGIGGLSGFVNGVLRGIIRGLENVEYPKEPIDFLAVKYSYPKWIIKYWLEEIDIEEIEKICIENNKAPRICAYINTLRIDKKSLKKIFAEDNITFSDGKLAKNAIYFSKTSDIAQLKAFKNGFFHIIDESAALCALVANPKAGETLIDVCAAPGGKSFTCAYIMENKGKIYARDIYEHKIDLINDGAKRLGIDIIESQLKSAEIKYEQDAEKADVVIVDAPCSGLGLLRKKPDIKYDKTMEDVESLAKLQRDILSVAQSYVKKGGVLLYSTCTISKKENIENVRWFCENFDFKLDDLTPFIGEHFDNEQLKKGYIQIMPHMYSTDGFFIARLRKAL